MKILININNSILNINIISLYHEFYEFKFLSKYILYEINIIIKIYRKKILTVKGKKLL